MDKKAFKIIMIILVCFWGGNSLYNNFQSSQTIEGAMAKVNVTFSKILYKADLQNESIVFYTNNNELRVGLLKKNFWGWKWIFGGGSVDFDSKDKIDWVYCNLGTSPQNLIPVFYGLNFEEHIKQIKIKGLTDKFKNAQIVNTELGQIWYVISGKPLKPPLTIIGLSDEGKILYEYNASYNNKDFKTTNAMSETDILQALNDFGISVSKIYKTEYQDDKAVAFYKETATQKLMAGLFEKRNNSWHFIIQNEIAINLADSKQLTFSASLNEKGINGLEMPYYYFSYGVIYNPQIKNLELRAIGTGNGVKQRTAKVITIEGQRIWYLIHDQKLLYNCQRAYAADGKIIFDSLEKHD